MEITAFREEKAKKAVGILVAATLPGLVRFGKEDKGIQLFLELAEFREFRSIVQREAMNRQASQGGYNSLACFGCRSGSYECTLNVARTAINECDSCSFSSGTDDRIAFPITHTHSVFDLIRPLRNDSVRMNRVEIGITVDLSFAKTPKVLFPINLGKQFAVDVPVNGGNADLTVRVFQ